MKSAKIVEKREVAPQTFIFKLDCNFDFEPGQFVMINSPSIPWVIPKPFSILSNRDGILILFKIYGLWTEKFSKLGVGESVNVLGPCGVGFLSSPKKYGVDVKFSKILFVAGGVGIASLFPLFEYLKDSKKFLVFGGRTERDIVLLDDIKSLGVEILPCTEDGTLGLKGKVTDALREVDVQSFDVVLSCGPVPMMKAVYDMLKDRGVPMFFAVEERMGCGIGICFSCAVRTADGVKLCCKDGPVFPADKLMWKF